MSIESFLDGMYEQTVEQHNFNYNQQWKQKLRKQFSEALGSFHPASHPDSVLLEKEDMGSYTRMRVEITTVDSLRMPVYVLIPNDTGNDIPAVMAIHGHGYGSKEVVGLQPDGSLRDTPGIHKNFAIELVNRGVMVFVPELIGFGDRKREEDQNGKPEDNSCYRLATDLLLMGKTLAGLRIEECRRLIDFIQTYPGVNRNNIGMMGLSGGALVTAFASVVDERIKATVISGYTNTFKGSIMDRRHCLDNYIPGVLQLAEMPDLIGLIAPRPLFIEAGKQDHLFPYEHVNIAINKLNEIYQSFDAEENLSSHQFDGGHEISGEKSYHWLVRQLTN